MTKKHFQKLAKILKEMVENQTNQIETINKIADMCEEENPRFSKDRFLQACGVKQNEKIC